MSLLKPLGTGQGYLKAGFQGFQKSGKTFTAIELAIGTREYMKHDGPMAMFDTETGSEYIAKRVKERTGKDLVGAKSRSFDTLLQLGRECVKEGISVLVVDSVTHIWRDVTESYLAQLNEARRKKGFGMKRALEFQDWGPIKRKWVE